MNSGLIARHPILLAIGVGTILAMLVIWISF